jgi:hypothetical protein
MSQIHVTQICGKYSNFDRIPVEVLQEAADRGTWVHEMIAAKLKGTAATGDSGRFDTSAGFLKSFDKWAARYLDHVFAVEKRFVHPTYDYTGQIDLIARITDGSLLVIDLKTPATAARSWRLQTAAYVELVNRNKINGLNRQIHESGTLRLFRDGRIGKLNRYVSTRDDFLIFLYALNVHRFFEGEK